ncbi:MAG: helix-turn-helix domain-containing protein [Salinarimonas sp.]
MVARGTTMLKAKRAVERALSDGTAVITLSHVDDATALSDELGSAGIGITFRSAADRDLKEHFSARLKALRERLGMSQEEFARTYNLETKTIQGWEIGKVPDRGNRHLIRMIEKDPVTIRRLVNEA